MAEDPKHKADQASDDSETPPGWGPPQDSVTGPTAPNLGGKPVVVLATLGLVATAIACVVALAYDVVVRGGDTAALVSVASIAVGALATLAGAASLGKRPDQREAG